jgi:predicted DNA-binding transcriptional regulator AlpA
MAKVQRKFVSVSEAAAIIGASPKFIYWHIKKGDFPVAQRIGRKIFISESALTKMLESKITNNKEDTANGK